MKSQEYEGAETEVHKLRYLNKLIEEMDTKEHVLKHGELH